MEGWKLSHLVMGMLMQAFAASSNKIVARYLKAENTNVSLLYLGAVGMLGSAVACVLLSPSIVLPKSAGLILQLVTTGEGLITAITTAHAQQASEQV